MDKVKKICMGLPHMGQFPWNTVASILSLQVPKGYGLMYRMVGSSVIYDARESIVNFARRSKCEYVFFIDSDMVVPAHAITNMLQVFEKYDADLVTGMIFKRIPPFQPCWYTKASYDLKKLKPYQESPIEFPKSGVMQIEASGMACCMIKVSLFDRIESPYFYPLPNAGEDLSFCYKAKSVRAKMYCDLSIDVGHVSTFAVMREHFDSYYQDFKNSKDDKKKLFDETESL